MLILVSVLVFYGVCSDRGLWWWRESPYTDSIDEQARKMSVLFTSYATARKTLPPLTRYVDYWTPDFESIGTGEMQFINRRSPFNLEMQEELARILFVEDSPDIEEATRIVAMNYVYIPWEVKSEEELERVVRHVSERRQTGEVLDGPLTINGQVFPEQDRAAAQFARRDAEWRNHALGGMSHLVPQSDDVAEPDASLAGIPVLLENVAVLDDVKGVNVLYADGVVRFIEFGTAFPASNQVASLFWNGTAPSDEAGRAFKAIFAERRNKARLILSAPLIIAGLSFVLFLGRKIWLGPTFIALMSFPVVAVKLSHSVPLQLYVPSTRILLFVDIVACWGLVLYMLAKHISTGSRPWARGIPGCFALLVYAVLWLPMLFMLFWIPPTNLGRP